jgi:RNA polymerase sigma factor (sigma-70 family)
MNACEFGKMYNDNYIIVVKIACSIVKDYALAKDVAQDVFASIWTASDSMKDVNFLPSFLYVCTRNRAFRKYRGEISKKKVQGEYCRYRDNMVSNECSFSNSLDYVLNNLITKRQKEIFELIHIHGLSHEEVGKKLNIAKYTISNHMKIVNKTIKQQYLQ